MIPSKAQKVGATMLIAGTAIGAGMLGMPIVSGVCGYFASICLILFSFLLMLANLFLLLEATLYCKDPYANIISLAREHLGTVWSIICWTCFMLLLYAVVASYINAGADLMTQMLEATFPMEIEACMLIFSAIFGSIILLGVSSIDKMNRVLMVGLIVTFILIIALMTPFLSLKKLSMHGQLKYIPNAFPIIAAAFTSHLVLPSVRAYIQNTESLKKILLIGSLIPLILYIMWQTAVVGIAEKTGAYSLMGFATTRSPIGDFLDFLIVKHQLYMIGSVTELFFLFAITTSFLGVLLSLNDFLADGLNITEKTMKVRFKLLALSIVPPLFFAIFSQSAFTLTLNFAGLFIAILYCIIPALVVIKNRKNQNTAEFILPGGWPAIAVILFFGILFAFLSLMSSQGWLPHP